MLERLLGTWWVVGMFQGFEEFAYGSAPCGLVHHGERGGSTSATSRISRETLL